MLTNMYESRGFRVGKINENETILYYVLIMNNVLA